MARFWVGVASREHVLAPVRGAFCQLNHGKETSVRRLQMGDRIVFYSPRERMEGSKSLQAFTSAGRILDEVPYQVEQSKDFRPFRRKTEYLKSKDASIHPLLEELSFTKGRSNWGAALRMGIFQMKHEDYLKIAIAMGITSEGRAAGFG
ncbi:MAG: EVE domain-containing protein [Candidatus Acidiferrales bacterium]